MNANELMIGNYLLNDNVVVKIDARSIFDIWDDKGLKNYKPIPITEKWLSDLCLSWNNGSIWLEEHNTNIKQVHQLQKLYFALTGNPLQLVEQK